MLSGFGITGKTMVPAGWYCSSLLISGFVIYYLLCRNRKRYLYFIAPFSCLIIISNIIHSVGNLNRWSQFDTFISTGTLRGFAEMSLGIICYHVYVYLIEKMDGRFKLISTSIELLCIFTLFKMIFVDGPSQSDSACVVFAAVLITSLFIGNSYISRFSNNPVFRYLGKISISIYLTHSVFLKMNWMIITNAEGKKEELLFCLFVILFSCIFTAFIEKMLGWIKNIKKESACF